MFSIRNVEKFVDDHPQLFNDKEAVMQRAREIAGDGKIIMGGGAEMIFGKKVASMFFGALQSDMQHMAIGLKDMAEDH